MEVGGYWIYEFVNISRRLGFTRLIEVRSMA